ncbi:MAG: hypothetical protein GDA36_12505, partial [Rhodobacteraceae bacterium]|nr:hypothetical protein [Paracoccaceae bacterium]
MFGGSFDLSILPGPVALLDLTSGKAVLVVCGLMRLPVFAGQVLPDCLHRQLGVCFDQPELSGGASSWHRHCSQPGAAFGVQPAPALFPSPQRSMTGGGSHDPVTVATTQSVPGWPIPACAFAPLTMVSNPGSLPGSQVPHVDLVDENFPCSGLVRVGKAGWMSSCSPAYLTHRACVSALKCKA